MALPGEIIENPATGERIEFLETRETTGGAFLEFELTLAPYGRVGGLPHQHPAQEIVDVLEGTMTCSYHRGRTEVGPGERVALPPRLDHYVFNATPAPVRARVTATPALDFETFFETVFALAAERRFIAFRGLPTPLHAALLSYTYEIYGPLVPIRLQRALLAPLAALAERRGYPARLDAESVATAAADAV